MIKGGVFMVLELKNISKYYGDRKILEIDNLKIYENEKIGIVGQNGSGKTTLLNMIAGRIEPDTGEIIHKQNIIYMEQFEEMTYENKNFIQGLEKLIYSMQGKAFTAMIKIQILTWFLERECFVPLSTVLNITEKALC